MRNKFVTSVVWIHFFIGDTQGNNTWLGHYNASCPMKRPYRDCWCQFLDTSLAHHRCIYITLSEINQAYAEMQQASTTKEKRKHFKQISKHPIKNAFIHGNLPLSDIKHRPFQMSPPKLLHTFGSGQVDRHCQLDGLPPSSTGRLPHCLVRRSLVRDVQGAGCFARVSQGNSQSIAGRWRAFRRPSAR